LNPYKPTPLKEFTAFYKLDYGDTTGITLVKDRNSIPGPLLYQPFQQNEISFTAVDKNGEGTFDNIHSGHIGQHVSIPGCRESRYDCLHMHWRWGNPLLKHLDPLIDPFTSTQFTAADRGKPYLVPGQTIDIAVVKASPNPSEQDPDNPLSLANGEPIAFAAQDDKLMSAQHPIIWYVSSGKSSKHNLL
jgi:hypothetical protein